MATWSALSEAVFTVDALRITEINYNPHDPTAAERAVNPRCDNDDFEFIELVNTGATLDLAGMHSSTGSNSRLPTVTSRRSIRASVSWWSVTRRRLRPATAAACRWRVSLPAGV